MKPITLHQCKSIVSQAVSNKYDELAVENLDEIISNIWYTAVSASREKDLIALLRPIKQFSDDVTNQVVVLLLIDKFWVWEPRIDYLLQRIHSALFGTWEHKQFRNSEFVQDYGGIIETPVLEVAMRLDEIERLCSSTLTSFSSAPLPLKALFLAYVFSAVIRIHPFVDGNGRTARMFVQYALTSWRLPAVEIPKVRNDSAWKLALANALRGNLSDLQAQFLQRLSNTEADT